MEKQNLFKTRELRLDTRLNGFYCYVTYPSDRLKIKEIPTGFIVGAAVGIKKNNLRTRSKYEAIERYCLYTKNTLKIKFESADITKKGYFPLKNCILYSQNQETKTNFPFLKRKSNKKIAWVKTKGLNGSDIFLPHHYIFPKKERNELKRVDTWSTNGGASHPSTNQAIINGVLELVERDTLMCSWISKSGISKIDKNTIDSKKLIKLIGLLKKEKLECFCSRQRTNLVLQQLLPHWIGKAKNSCHLVLRAKRTYILP